MGSGAESGRVELSGAGGTAHVLPAARVFPEAGDVPVVVIDHVRAALGLAADVGAVHESDRTLWRHRDYVRMRMGMVYQPAAARAVPEDAIRAAVTTKDNPVDLINVALEELVRARCELPGFITLDKMVAAIRTETNIALFAVVAARLDAADRRRLARLLWLDPTSRRSEFDRLKTPAKAASMGKFKLRLAHLQALDELGATERWLEGIPAAKIVHFAGEARVTDVGDLRDIGEAKRWTLLASLIHECRSTVRDEVATMFCKRMAVIHKKGKSAWPSCTSPSGCWMCSATSWPVPGKPPHQPSTVRRNRLRRWPSEPGGCC